MTRTSNALALILLGALLLIGSLLTLLPGGGARSSGSVRSTEEDGRRALYLLFEELGYQVAGWNQAPGYLPRGSDVLYLPDTPETPPGYASRPGASRLRDPRHYLRFVEEGGTLITPVDGDAHFEFLAEELGLGPVRELVLDRSGGDDDRVTHVTLVSGERLKLEWKPSATFQALSVTSPVELLAMDDEGRGLALRLAVGRGSVVLLAPADEWLNNDQIENGDHALFIVRLIEECASSGRILFDEYVLGGWVPDSPIALAFGPASFAFSLHLILWGLLALWMVVWARPFPRDPQPLSQVSALVRAQGFAGMIANAKRWNLLARMLKAGVLRRLSARAGRAGADGDAPLELDGDEVKRVLDLVMHGASPEQKTAAAALLWKTRVTRLEELERLGERLAELERMVLVPER
jgi:hypothetical protein